MLQIGENAAGEPGEEKNPTELREKSGGKQDSSNGKEQKGVRRGGSCRVDRLLVKN